MLVNGKWVENWQPVQSSDAEGRFIRQISGFRHRIGSGPDARFPAVAGRYQLYVTYICPWASRTLIALGLKGLESAVEVRPLDPRLTDQGWIFSGGLGTVLDEQLGATYLHEFYTQAEPGYTGRATVPILWDKQEKTIVNNESADILSIFNKDFGEMAKNIIDLCPSHLERDISQANDRLYDSFNNGVYKAGFASTQSAYQEAVAQVFDVLDWLSSRLKTKDWLVGDQLTESDIRAFVTLIRFDLAYYGLFKCNLHPLNDYPAVTSYLRRLLAIPAFAASVKPEHIKVGYYSIRSLNPNGIVPSGPNLDYLNVLSV